MSPRKTSEEIFGLIYQVLQEEPAVTIGELEEKTGINAASLHRYLDLIQEIQGWKKITSKKSGKTTLFFCRND